MHEGVLHNESNQRHGDVRGHYPSVLACRCSRAVDDGLTKVEANGPCIQHDGVEHALSHREPHRDPPVAHPPIPVPADHDDDSVPHHLRQKGAFLGQAARLEEAVVRARQAARRGPIGHRLSTTVDGPQPARKVSVEHHASRPKEHQQPNEHERVAECSVDILPLNDPSPDSRRCQDPQHAEEWRDGLKKLEVAEHEARVQRLAFSQASFEIPKSQCVQVTTHIAGACN
mmetsp:Transcript_116243/g.173653  ORF Transcript_116243/g.173653 Transcript_116243/m.173653 type:complete len:229 (-) Transcript_116243:261-947(-)